MLFAKPTATDCEFVYGQVATGGVLVLHGTITTIKTIHFVVFHSSSKEYRQLNNLANAVANGIFSKTTNQKLNELEQEKEDLEIKIARQKAKTITPLDADKVYNWFLSFQNIDTTDKLACKRMIDMFVNKIVLYDDYFDIYFNTSDDESKNIKLDNPEDFEEIEKEQPSGSDCSHLVPLAGFEPARMLLRGILSPLRLPVSPQRRNYDFIDFAPMDFHRGEISWRRHPDLNRGIRVLQTLALPLGYSATPHASIACLFYHKKFALSNDYSKSFFISTKFLFFRVFS